ncbi:MAG: glycosyltransferase family 39 protein [Bryobacteraceae bacterium]|nr:glycosyltransferase family 39 protein [Bryobacteraceae bacterium]
MANLLLISPPTPASPAAGIRERFAHRALIGAAAATAFGLLAHLLVLLWAGHDLTPVEAVVALQAKMLSQGEGLYWGVNRYPYSYSAYGPIFYGLSGALQRMGVPPYHSGRLISFAALLAALWLVWRILGQLSGHRLTRTTGTLLAASTANLLFWGTVGQTDMLACACSLAAFAAFLTYRDSRAKKHLALAGLLVILSVFTKQTFIAAAAAISLTLLWEDRRRALSFLAGLALAGGGLVFALNTVTHGGYYEDAVIANMNPFAWFKLGQQVQYLALTGCGVLAVAAAGLGRVTRRTAPLLLYAFLSTAVWLLTSPKIGSDLNYQLEMMLVMAMCAGVTLDRLDFFPRLFNGRRHWVTLLQIPLALHLILNLLLIARTVAERAILQPFKERETIALRPYLERPGRVFSVQYDSLVHHRGRIDMEPFTFALLVEAGVTDPGPVTRDLENQQFGALLLPDNVFTGPITTDAEQVHLPPQQLDVIRRRYRLVKQVDGPNAVFVYEPRPQ